MNHRVTIEIRSVQAMDGEREEQTVKAKGRLRFLENGAVLQYMTKEPEILHTKLTLEEAACLLETRGAREMSLAFTRGEKTTGKMRLPFGEWELQAQTRRYEVRREGEEGLDVFLEYRLFYEKKAAAEHRLAISVRPLQG